MKMKVSSAMYFVTFNKFLSSLIMFVQAGERTGTRQYKIALLN